MDSVTLTGGHGFLGWHTRCAAHSRGWKSRTLRVGDRFREDDAATAISGSSRLIHIAGINRGKAGEVREGNVLFATQVEEGLRRAANPPSVVVFANSIQAGTATEYGQAKLLASEILRRGADAVGADFVDLRLPNLFGEHGRPFYNSVVATFCHQLAMGATPRVEQDRELVLLHAQTAAEQLIGAEESNEDGAPSTETVGGLLVRLRAIASTYESGEFPDLSEPFGRDLFNTYRASRFGTDAFIELSQNRDARGSFVELAKAHGGAGQTSFSTTRPGITRGNHYHRRKVERFAVISGSATISLRRLFTATVLEFKVTGENPVAIDMPTMWAHKITNTGGSDLLTAFWSNEIFDSARPDTTMEPV